MKHNIVVAGDFVPREDVAPYDPFSDDIKKLFKSSSYVIINLETPLTKRGRPILKTGVNFRRDPKYAKILKDAGIDCVCLANNHMRDYGDEGVEDTIKNCKEAGLDVIGAGMNKAEASMPLIKEIKGQRVAFLNYCEKEFSIASDNRAGSNPYEDVLAYYDITKLKKEVEKVVVIYHGGLEYQHMPTLEMVKSFRFMIDVGADAIISHHAHAYSGYETYREKPIYYGLGNFFFSFPTNHPSEQWLTGILAKLEFLSIETIEIIPIRINERMDRVDLIDYHDGEKVVENINEINSRICSDLLAEYWNKYNKYAGINKINNLNANSKIGARLRRMIFKKNHNLTLFKLLNWINCFRCESHRNSIISFLEENYNMFNRD